MKCAALTLPVKEAVMEAVKEAVKATSAVATVATVATVGMVVEVQWWRRRRLRA